MAYADDETSQAAGEPVELYAFVGSTTTWRYASGASSVTLAGDTYTPLAGLIRSSVASGSSRDAPTLTVRLPSSAGVVTTHGFAIPPRNLSLSVYRVQQRSGDYAVIWLGEVTTISPAGAMAEVRVPSLLGARLATNVPGLSVQKLCQHFLGDARCRVDMTAFDHATTVSSVSDRTVTVAGVGAVADQWFRAGEIVRDSDGERRTIVDQVGGVLKIHAAFRSLSNGDAVTLYAGCDHTSTTCSSKFGNRINFGGFPAIPQRNPFRLALRLGKD